MQIALSGRGVHQMYRRNQLQSTGENPTKYGTNCNWCGRTIFEWEPARRSVIAIAESCRSHQGTMPAADPSTSNLKIRVFATAPLERDAASKGWSVIAFQAGGST